MFDIKENLKKLPDNPGVYIHKDRLGEVIYVGKAVSLKNRVRQYFQSQKNMDAKVRAMVAEISEFEYITCASEMEAFILECNLIKKYRPKYNILLRDDKTYPYIKVTTSEEWPRIVKTREAKNSGDRYFGPYSDVGAVKTMVELLADMFSLKRCAMQKFPSDHRACLNKHIGRCDGICIGDVDHDEYMERVEQVIRYLKGYGKDIEESLREKMEEAAANMDYEKAARYRDHLEAAKSLHEKQRVVLNIEKDIDVVVAVTKEHIAVFYVRGGKLSGRGAFSIRGSTNEQQKEVIKEFIRQHYGDMTEGPGEMLLASEIAEKEMMEGYLADLWGHSVKISVPKRGEKKALLDLALRNADEMEKNINEKERSKEERRQALRDEIDAILKDAGYQAKASSDEYRIEAYDISNTNGLDQVGAMVVFRGLEKEKKSYRRFKIRTAAGSDDYGSMQEVLYRRFKRAHAGDHGFSELPDVLMMDGGSGHVRAALDVLKTMGMDIPVFGMVKSDDHRTRGLVFIKGGAFEEKELKEHPLLFKYIGNMQEEVHRFAIEHHRKLRDQGKLTSALDDIEGIGAVRRNALLAHFGSLQNIKVASEEELCQVTGITPKLAQRIKHHFH